MLSVVESPLKRGYLIVNTGLGVLLVGGTGLSYALLTGEGSADTSSRQTARVARGTLLASVSAKAANALYVPAAAVRTAGGQSTVTVLQGGRRVDRTVEFGIKGDQGTEIKSGLDAGDQVVLSTTGGGPPGNIRVPGGGVPGAGLGGCGGGRG
jgi:hypothetical protein